MHPFAVLVNGTGGIVVEQDLQLVGGASMVQQGGGKVLALFSQLLVLVLEQNQSLYINIFWL